jgi:phosphatidate phosphatase APP1
MASIDDTVKASGLTGDKAAALRSEAIKNAHKTIATLNGAARY